MVGLAGLVVPPPSRWAGMPGVPVALARSIIYSNFIMEKLFAFRTICNRPRMKWKSDDQNFLDGIQSCYFEKLKVQ